MIKCSIYLNRAVFVMSYVVYNNEDPDQTASSHRLLIKVISVHQYLQHYSKFLQADNKGHGPVVQSIVSLTSHFVNCFSGFNTQYSDIFC